MTPEQRDAWAALAEAAKREWLWRDATDDMREGCGHHMAQMLFRLPMDGQTRDMQASIEALATALPALLAENADLRAKLEAADVERVWDAGWKACESFSGRTWSHVKGWADRNPYRAH